jgi:hypothetical protein
MTDMLEPVFSAGLAELEASAGEPDWPEVRRKARSIVARRLVVRAGAGAAVALAAALLVTPAFGLRGQLAHLFTSGKPAPAPVVRGFAGLDVYAPPGMATGVIAAEARSVMEVHLSTGKTETLWVAPTRAGGFCMGLGGPGGCDRDRVLRFSPEISIPRISAEGEITAAPVIISGSTLVPGATTMEVRFDDGGYATTPVVWVSQPIDAGFFVYEVPRQHWAVGRRPTLLLLEDEAGHELARNTELGGAFNDGIRAMTQAARDGSRSP